jgi:hypothetical protein
MSRDGRCRAITEMVAEAAPETFGDNELRLDAWESVAGERSHVLERRRDFAFSDDTIGGEPGTVPRTEARLSA